MKKVTLVEFSDLLHHAETIGYFWNQAHEILVKDEVPPMYETKTSDIDKTSAEDFGWSEDSKKIVESFMEKNNLEEFTLV